jgi:hypothetical protein
MPQENPFVITLNTLEIRLDSPPRIQAFLDSIPYSSEPVNRSPLQVLQDRIANCFDGALFAAAALRQLGYPPLILDLLPDGRDDDHILALFKREGHWGAIAKSNFAGLRFREPVYRTLRELVLSYFEQYYNVEREKTLRGYTLPLNLERFDRMEWMTSEAPIERIGNRLDEIRRFELLTPAMTAGLSPVDDRLYQAGLLGADEAGLFKP